MTKYEMREAGLLKQKPSVPLHQVKDREVRTTKVLDDDLAWSLVDDFENSDRTKTTACFIIGEAYKNLGKTNREYLDEAYADVDFLLKGNATQRQYNLLKNTYFK